MHMCKSTNFFLMVIVLHEMEHTQHIVLHPTLYKLLFGKDLLCEHHNIHFDL